MTATLRTDARQLKNATVVDEVICLSTLIAFGELPTCSDTVDAVRYFNTLDQAGKDCSDCPCFSRCLLVAMYQ